VVFHVRCKAGCKYVSRNGQGFLAGVKCGAWLRWLRFLSSLLRGAVTLGVTHAAHHHAGRSQAQSKVGRVEAAERGQPCIRVPCVESSSSQTVRVHLSSRDRPRLVDSRFFTTQGGRAASKDNQGSLGPEEQRLSLR